MIACDLRKEKQRNDSDLVNACDSEFVDTYTNDLVNFCTHVCGKMTIYKYCRQHTV